MQELSAIRDNWDEIEAQEARLLRGMSVQESMGHLLALQRVFEYQLQQTEDLFRPDRLIYLATLQARLQCLGEWHQKHHGKPASIHCGASDTPG
ncbi:MAG: hypothetical protein JW850_09985 [Thermoflexales bacterium]|nr:hypothetical protein [Thermoflexales bacterium]